MRMNWNVVIGADPAELSIMIRPRSMDSVVASVNVAEPCTPYIKQLSMGDAIRETRIGEKE